eukprot:m.25820 g.25820  ORF g.25820 m.25820 type:complete len:93 (+) comp28982_c0_seq2:1009-1287(+)
MWPSGSGRNRVENIRVSFVVRIGLEETRGGMEVETSQKESGCWQVGMHVTDWEETAFIAGRKCSYLQMCSGQPKPASIQAMEDREIRSETNL